MSSRIYLSAVASELREARAVATHLLRSRGCYVVYEEGFDGGEGDWRQAVQASVGRCDALIQLVGEHFGVASPEMGDLGGQWSYTQYEGEFARRSGLPVFYLLLEPEFSAARLESEGDEERALQEAYRGHVSMCGDQISIVSDMAGLDQALAGLGTAFSARKATVPVKQSADEVGVARANRASAASEGQRPADNGGRNTRYIPPAPLPRARSSGSGRIPAWTWAAVVAAGLLLVGSLAWKFTRGAQRAAVPLAVATDTAESGESANSENPEQTAAPINREPGLWSVESNGSGRPSGRDLLSGPGTPPRSRPASGTGRPG